MKILIDNGHGSDTKGKRSPVWDDGRQLLEWSYNRTIANEVVKQLLKNGVNCDLLVPEHKDISLSERVKRANNKAKALGKNNILLVSIHVNAYNGKASGWQVHTSKGKSKSDKFASVFHDTAKKVLGDRFPLRGDFSDGDADFENDFTILKKTICPALLTENLFMDNEKDCRFLMSSEGKNAIIKIHVESIFKIINNVA